MPGILGNRTLHYYEPWYWLNVNKCILGLDEVQSINRSISSLSGVACHWFLQRPSLSRCSGWFSHRLPRILTSNDQQLLVFSQKSWRCSAKSQTQHAAVCDNCHLQKMQIPTSTLYDPVPSSLYQLWALRLHS